MPTKCKVCGGSGEVATSEERARELERMRSAAGLSLRELAHRTGLSHSYVHDIETARRRPSQDAWDRLLIALGHELEVE